MSWKTLTADEVMEEFTPQEAAMLRGIQGAQDKLPGVLTRVVSMARGYIRAGGYPVGEDGTTPDQLDADLVAIARWRWLVSFPQLKALQTKERKEAHDSAMDRLEQIAAQKMAVEPPTAGNIAKSGSWNSENKIVGRTHPVPPPAVQYPNSSPTGHPYANPDGPVDQ